MKRGIQNFNMNQLQSFALITMNIIYMSWIVLHCEYL